MELTIDQRPLKFLHLDLFSDNIPFLLYFFHFTPNYSFWSLGFSSHSPNLSDALFFEPSIVFVHAI